MRNTLIYFFGPLVQIFLICGSTLLFACLLAVLAYRAERWLIQLRKFLWTLPFLPLLTGLVYGTLRFSGRLVYPEDGWDTTIRAMWDYTNQNQGASFLYICGCLLVGVVLALYKTKASKATDSSPAP